MRLHKEDEVLVLQGKDKGKKGKIEKIISRKNQVFVSGVNLYKKHVKKSGDKAGGIFQVMKPLDASKVVLICSKCNLPTKAEFKTHENQKKRICKKCKQEI